MWCTSRATGSKAQSGIAGRLTTDHIAGEFKKADSNRWAFAVVPSACSACPRCHQSQIHPSGNQGRSARSPAKGVFWDQPDFTELEEFDAERSSRARHHRPEFDWDDYKGMDVKESSSSSPTNRRPTIQFFGAGARTRPLTFVRGPPAGASRFIIHTNETAGYPYRSSATR